MMLNIESNQTNKKEAVRIMLNIYLLKQQFLIEQSEKTELSIKYEITVKRQCTLAPFSMAPTGL